MKAGVSTACLYPMYPEEALYDMALNGIQNTEIFINSECELRKGFISSLRDMLMRFDVSCFSVHPYTSSFETMMLFSAYKRRADDMIEYYKRYFDVMNSLGAKVFVFHGCKAGGLPQNSVEFYCERLSKLICAGRNCGITVAQENVSYCESGSLSFLTKCRSVLGSEMKLMLDIKQAVRSKENPFDFVRKFGSDIVGVHMSDHGQSGDCLQIGRGSFNIKGFISELRSSGSDADIILELYRSGFSGTPDLAMNCIRLSNMIMSGQKKGE